MAKRRRSRKHGRRGLRGLGCHSCGTAGLGRFSMPGTGLFGNPMTTAAIVIGGLYVLNRARKAGGGSVVSGLGNWMSSFTQQLAPSASPSVGVSRFVGQYGRVMAIPTATAPRGRWW